MRFTVKKDLSERRGAEPYRYLIYENGRLFRALLARLPRRRTRHRFSGWHQI